MIQVSRPSLGIQELEAVGGVFDSGWLGMGPAVERFEAALSDYLGVRHVFAVINCTSALQLALKACSAGPGREVVLPSFTFVGGVQAVLATGAVPVFCDIRANDMNMDPADLEGLINERTAAVMPVHFGGACCDMDSITGLARDKGVPVVEDAAHAFGSSCSGRMAGTLGDAGCFSFDPIKNITCGGGGALVTGDGRLAKLFSGMRNIGMDRDGWSRRTNERIWEYTVATEGHRFHMPDMNAAVGLVQLKRAGGFRDRKLEIVRNYDDAFGELDGLVTLHRDWREIFPFSYTVRVTGGRRDALATQLRGRGVSTTVHFVPNHTQPLFRGFARPLPVTERMYGEVLNLPLHVEMTDGDVGAVIESVRAFFKIS